MSPKRIELFDVLKVVAIIFICGAHVMSVIEFFLPRPFVLGQVENFPYFMMSLGLYFLNIFIFISGYLAWQSSSQITSFRHVFSLIGKRWLKLYLPVWIFLAVVFMFSPVLIKPLWVHLLPASNLVSISLPSLKWLWYVALDFQLHLVFYPLFSFLSRKSLSFTAFVFAILILLGFLTRYFIAESSHLTASYLLASFPNESFSYYDKMHMPFWTRFIPFLSGAALAILDPTEFRLSSWKRILFLSLGIAASVGLFQTTSFNLTVSSWNQSSLWIASGDVICSLIIFSFCIGFWNFQMPFSAGFRWLSSLVFGIYLVHQFNILGLFKLKTALWWVPVPNIFLLWLSTFVLAIPVSYALNFMSLQLFKMLRIGKES